MLRFQVASLTLLASSGKAKGSLRDYHQKYHITPGNLFLSHPFADSVMSTAFLANISCPGEKWLEIFVIEWRKTCQLYALLTPTNSPTELFHDIIELISGFFGRTGLGCQLLGNLVGETYSGRDFFIALILVVDSFVQVSGYIHDSLDILQEHLSIGVGVLG